MNKEPALATNSESTAQPAEAVTGQFPYEIQPISPEEQDERGWQLEVNGEVVTEEISKARLVQQKMGVEIIYGQRPEGFDGPIIHEAGGGGAVTIPYMIHPQTNDIYIGVVRENRPTMGGEVWNVPRGFLDPGESHEDTARRELAEETGYQVLGRRMIKLVEGLNPNSTFFDTTPHSDDKEAPGVSVFTVGVQHNELVKAEGPNGEPVYAFPEGVRKSAAGNKAGERIMSSMFIPISEAIRSQDMFTSAAAGQLLAAFFEGRIGYHPDLEKQTIS